MTTSENIPNPRLSKGFLRGLYTPEFIPDDLDITNFIQLVDADEDVEKSLERKSISTLATDPRPGTVDGVPVPLTEAEAREADRQIQATLDRIAQAKREIQGVRALLAKRLNPGDGTEYRFKMDISRKRRIKRAIKKLFGYKTDTITYSMYLEMLEAKKELEAEQATSYTKGFGRKSKGSSKNNKIDKPKKDKDTSDKKGKQKGFLERSARGEDAEDGSSQQEEQYLRMFPKIGRDFVYRGDFEREMSNILELIDPLGKAGGRSDVIEAKKRAREYQAVLESGKDGSKIYKDLIKLEDD